jgi:uncharacterized membrane protein YedE/YeeE
MLEQDWIFGFLGGLMIGGGGVIYLLFNGRILGASGVLGGLADGTGWDTWKERASFIAGLILLPFVLTFLWVRPDTHLNDNWAVLIGAGLLVGIGARLANGCTSGHGVCGISRLSFRGIAATVVYLLAGGISILVFRHLLGVI